MDIFYLYAYATQQLLFITTNQKEYKRIWDAYEDAGVMCYGVDFESMINNVKLEQKALEESEE